MLNLRGDICISNDMNDLEKCRFTHKIISIGELDRSIASQFNVLSGALFMPPYEAVMQEMDGNIEGFRLAYFNHLYSPECQEYIALIFRALYGGTNILLFLSKDESELLYSKALLEFLNVNYGLMISPSIQTQSGFNQQYSSIVSELMYTFDLITVNEMFMARLDNPFSPPTIMKLSAELNPYLENRSFESYQNYFIHLQQMTKQANKPIVNGLVWEN